MKPGSNFKMSKSGKIYLAQTWNRPNKSARRKTLIQSELYAAVVVKSRREREGS